MKERQRQPIEQLKHGGRVAFATLMLVGTGLGTAACDNDKNPSAPTPTPISRTLTVNVDKFVLNVGEIATATATPRPTETPRPTATPEVRQPDWIRQPVSSEIYVPYDGTTIRRTVGPSQIVAISGGPMIIDYLDRNGYGKSLSFAGGSDTVTLALFLGDQRQINPVNVRGVVPLHNWVGTYNTPDQNPTNPQNWQALQKAKVLETMFGSGSIPGGAKFVDIVVIDGGNHLIHQNRIARQ